MSGPGGWEKPEEVPFSALTIGTVIGTGSDKTVYLGTFRECTVAISMFRVVKAEAQSEKKATKRKGPAASKSNPTAVAVRSNEPCEAECFMYKHQHLSSPIARAVDPKLGTVHIVSELARYGGLDRVIGECPGQLSLDVKLSIIEQITSACRYLIDNGMIHRDISARNVLVCKLHPSKPDVQHTLVKLTDFGHACELASPPLMREDQGMPVRWMPPEALLENKWGEKSDVWALGVFAWEVMFEEPLPWADFDTDDGVTMAVSTGKTLEMPRHLPASGSQNGSEGTIKFPPRIRDLIQSCWRLEPSQRPHFGEISGRWTSKKYDKTRPRRGGGLLSCFCGGGAAPAARAQSTAIVSRSQQQQYHMLQIMQTLMQLGYGEQQVAWAVGLTQAEARVFGTGAVTLDTCLDVLEHMDELQQANDTSLTSRGSAGANPTTTAARSRV